MITCIGRSLTVGSCETSQAGKARGSNVDITKIVISVYWSHPMGALILLHDYTDVNKAHPPFHFPAFKVSSDRMWLKKMSETFTL